MNKLLGLEIVRFLCACGVLFVHYHHLCHIDPAAADLGLKSYPFYHSFPFLYALGGMWAVEAFWCLSGYIFFWKYQHLIAARKVDLKAFFISRFARLYPLHFMTLILIAVGQSVYFHMTGNFYLKSLNSAPLFIGQLFMACNRTLLPESFNFPVWSVSVEVMVYLIFFLVTRYVTTSLRFNLFIILAFMITSLFNLQGPLHLTSLLECLLFFYTGGAAAVLRKHADKKDFPHKTVWFAAVVIPILFWYFGALSSDNGTYWFLVIWLPILMYCCSGGLNVSRPVAKAIETCGNMTYSSYLIHFPLQLLIAIICYQLHIQLPIFNSAFFFGYLFLVLTLSFFIYRHYEVPLKNLILKAASSPKI